jgi:hypothetical protein
MTRLRIDLVRHVRGVDVDAGVIVGTILFGEDVAGTKCASSRPHSCTQKLHVFRTKGLYHLQPSNPCHPDFFKGFPQPAECGPSS